MNTRIATLLFMLCFIVSLGTIGFHIIEGWPLFDSLYFTVITLTTIGFSEIHPLSENGRIFTLVVIFLGVGNTAYILSVLFQYLIELRFLDRYGRKRMEDKISKLEFHTIVCGYGNMGEQICEQLKMKNQPFVVIDRNPDLLAHFKEKGYTYLIGNASDDNILKNAGIDKAANLISVVTSDSENVFITLSARTLSKVVKIVSRVYEDSSKAKLKKAGANKIISPYHHASMKIVQSILNPAVDDFLEFVSDAGKIDYQLADIYVTKDMACTNKTLREISLKDKGLVIVGIRRKDGEMVLAPKKNDHILHGDRILAIGSKENFSDLVNVLTQSY